MLAFQVILSHLSFLGRRTYLNSQGPLGPEQGTVVSHPFSTHPGSCDLIDIPFGRFLVAGA